ncbi:MAG: response regulator [Oscillospiraceae bacterium]|jgi:two-component system sensor histidine kinase YesM|nr:response regulator [Oscillospiraceae bacterium]
MQVYDVLLVDDEIHALHGLAAMFDWTGRHFAQPILATSMKQAISAIQDTNIDILVCDIQMPNGTGLDLLSWIHDNVPDIVTVFLTFYARFDYAKTAFNLGAFDYLLKPVDEADLSTTLSHCSKRVDDIRILRRERIDLPSAADAAGKSIVGKVIEYIDENLRNALTRRELCGVAYVHQDYLSAIFRKETGQTISEYIFEKRMSFAMKLLRETDRPIGMICEMVGYSYNSHFSKMFKMKTGLSPQQYRSGFRRP